MSASTDDIFASVAPTRGTFSEAAKKAFANSDAVKKTLGELPIAAAATDAERAADLNATALATLRAIRVNAPAVADAPAAVDAPAVADAPAAADAPAVPVAAAAAKKSSKKRAAPVADAPEGEAAAPEGEAAAPAVQKRSRLSAGEALAKEAERARAAEAARVAASERKQEAYERARAAYVNSLGEVLAGSFDRRLLMGAFTHALATGARSTPVLAVRENAGTLTGTLSFFGSVDACSWSCERAACHELDAKPLLEQAARAFLVREDVRAATLKSLTELVPGIELSIAVTDGSGYVCTARLVPEPADDADEDK